MAKDKNREAATLKDSKYETLPRFHKCFICGKDNKIGLNTTFSHDGEEVFTELMFREDYVGYDQIVHGGIITAVLDETAMWACVIKTDKIYFTIELNVKFKKKLPPNLKVRATGRIVELKRSYAVAESRIEDEDKNIYASATGKYFPVPEEEAEKIREYLHKDSK